MRESKESDYLSAVQALIRGEKLYTVSSRYGIHHYKLQLLRKRYEERGLPGLLEPRGLRRYNLEDRLSIIRDIEQNHISLLKASLKYDIAHTELYKLLKAYRSKGEEGIATKRDMARKKRQTSKEYLDELEELRRRNEYLEAENALLKKVIALVEERESRLRAIGRKSSKN